MEKEVKKKRTRRKLSKEEKKARADRMREITRIRVEKQKAKKAELAPLTYKNMPANHKMFVDLYLYDEETKGKAAKSYEKAFGNHNKDSCSTLGVALLKKPHIQKYIDKHIGEFEEIAKIEKMKNIQTLVNIRDEMSKAQYKNRFGEINGVPACRSVAIKSIETLNKMMGFDKPQEVNVNHGADKGITFNVIIPEDKNKVIEAESVDYEEVE